MIWFLRLFAAYRDLEQRVAEAAAARIAAEDEARAWRSRFEVSEANAKALTSQLDRAWQEMRDVMRRPAFNAEDAHPPAIQHRNLRQVIADEEWRDMQERERRRKEAAELAMAEQAATK